jgi:hypothetical protein
VSDAAGESIFMDSNTTERPKHGNGLAGEGRLGVEASPSSERQSMVRSSVQKCNSKEYLDAAAWKKCQLLG